MIEGAELPLDSENVPSRMVEVWVHNRGKISTAAEDIMLTSGITEGLLTLLINYGKRF